MHYVLARNETRPYDEPHLFAHYMQPLGLAFCRPLVLLVCLSATVVPAQDKRYFNHKSSLTFTNSRAVDFAVRGDQAFVTDFLSSEQYQIRVIDVSNPGYLSQIASVVGPGRADGVEVGSNYVYVLAMTDSVRELHIFENSAPPHRYPVGDSFSFQVANNRAYLAWSHLPSYQYGFRILDVSNLASVATITNYYVRGVMSAWGLGDMTMYLISGFQVTAVDVSNPSDPRRVGSISLQYPIVSVASYAGYAYVAYSVFYSGPGTSPDGFHVFNVGDPANPVRVNTYPLTEARHLIVSGSRLLALEPERLLLFDISQPADPVLQDSLYCQGVLYFSMVGDTLYVTQDLGRNEAGVPLRRFSAFQLEPTARPRLLPIADATVAEDSGEHRIPIAIEDPDTPWEALTVEPELSSEVVTRPRVVMTDGRPEIWFQTLRDRSGTSAVTLRVTDSDRHTTEETFLVHVSPVNDLPVGVISSSAPALLEASPGHFRIKAVGSTAIIALQAGGSTDVESTQLNYKWFLGNSREPISRGKAVTTRLRIGTHRISLRVSDGEGSSVATARIDVVSAAPLAIPNRSGLFWGK